MKLCQTVAHALLELLDLPGVYSRLIGELREPIANAKEVLSILAPTTFATRNDLVDSIERQLRRSNDPDLHVANANVNVAQTRSLEAERRGLAVYGKKRIPKRGVESLFHCEPSRLRNGLPPHLKAPIPIASDQTAGLLDDLQNRVSIVYVDHFFDAKGNQIQDTQVARDPLPECLAEKGKKKIRKHRSGINSMIVFTTCLFTRINEGFFFSPRLTGLPVWQDFYDLFGRIFMTCLAGFL
jgi:hypothetical protein